MSRLFIALLFTLSLAACGGSDSSSNDTGSTPPAADTDSGSDTGDTGDTDDSTDTGDGSSDEGGSDSGNQTAQCTPTGVGIAFTSATATAIGDPDRGPEKLVDGCAERAGGWSGDYGTVVTLDAGSVHEMQGIYLWSTFSRMEAFRLETSTNAESWSTSYTLTVTKPESGPVYFPFNEPGPVRYVRLTWFGSDVNSWSNINEARWSLSGFAGFNGSRMRAKHSNGVTDSAGRTRGRTELSAFDIHLLTELNPSIAFTGHAGCYADTSPVLSMVDATGNLDSEMETVDHLGHRLFLVDWNYYTDPGMADEFVSAIPVGFAYYSWLQELNAAGRLGPEQFCDISGLGDYYYAQGTRVWELRTGQTQPNPGVWK